MEVTKVHSPNTPLKDRTLWYDGDSSFNPDNILTLIQEYDVEYVDYVNELIKQYNDNVSSKEKEIKVKQECRPLSFKWTIPQQYQNLDIVEYLFDKHIELTQTIELHEIEQRDRRLLQEIAKYQKFNLFDVLRTIIYVINTLTANNVVWGIGRGSSVSSYVLYVIGVHDVDSFAYNLDIDDFLHE